MSDLLLIGLKSDFLQGLHPLESWVQRARDQFGDIKISNVYRVAETRSETGWLSELWAVVGISFGGGDQELVEQLTLMSDGLSIDATPLLWGEKVMLHPELPIPHPDLHRKLVFLQCASEVDGRIKHPILGQTLDERLNQEKRRLPLEFYAQGRHILEKEKR